MYMKLFVRGHMHRCNCPRGGTIHVFLVEIYMQHHQRVLSMQQSPAWLYGGAWSSQARP
jgi:hypothetical protein